MGTSKQKFLCGECWIETGEIVCKKPRVHFKELLKKMNDKHKKHDEKRSTLERLPGTRLKEDKSKIMSRFYKVDKNASKSDLIVEAAEFVLKNKKEFVAFRKGKLSS